MRLAIIQKSLLAILSSSLIFQRALRSLRTMVCIYLRNEFNFWNVNIAPDKAAYCVFTQFRGPENAIKLISVRTKTQ